MIRGVFVLVGVAGEGRGRARSAPRHVDRERVGVAGHSLGAVTAIGVGVNSCCRDPHVGAVEISGLDLPFPGGDYTDWPDTPLPSRGGATEDLTPVAAVDEIVAQATPPTYYLRVPEGDNYTAAVRALSGECFSIQP